MAKSIHSVTQSKTPLFQQPSISSWKKNSLNQREFKVSRRSSTSSSSSSGVFSGTSKCSVVVSMNKAEDRAAHHTKSINPSVQESHVKISPVPRPNAAVGGLFLLHLYDVSLTLFIFFCLICLAFFPWIDNSYKSKRVCMHTRWQEGGWFVFHVTNTGNICSCIFFFFAKQNT